MYRLTVVLEYDNVELAPPIGINTKEFGHARVASLQFSDALAELESLYQDHPEIEMPSAYRGETDFQSGSERLI